MKPFESQRWNPELPSTTDTSASAASVGSVSRPGWCLVRRALDELRRLRCFSLTESSHGIILFPISGNYRKLVDSPYCHRFIVCESNSPSLFRHFDVLSIGFHQSQAKLWTIVGWIQSELRGWVLYFELLHRTGGTSVSSAVADLFSKTRNRSEALSSSFDMLSRRVSIGCTVGV